jgi:hypothetical protein
VTTSRAGRQNGDSPSVASVRLPPITLNQAGHQNDGSSFSVV